MPAMWETWVRSLDQEDPLEKEMATHSSILAWSIPWTGGAWWATVHRSQRVGHDWTNSLSLWVLWASLVVQTVKNPLAIQGTWVDPWVGKIPWRRERLPTPVFCSIKFHGLNSPWCCKESDRTEQLSLTHTEQLKCSSDTIIQVLLLLLLNRFSRVRLCATPQTAAHQAPPSLGFSRQEH